MLDRIIEFIHSNATYIGYIGYPLSVFSYISTWLWKRRMERKYASIKKENTELKYEQQECIRSEYTMHNGFMKNVLVHTKCKDKGKLVHPLSDENLLDSC